jgi:hypothetical protein
MILEHIPSAIDKDFCNQFSERCKSIRGWKIDTGKNKNNGFILYSKYGNNFEYSYEQELRVIAANILESVLEKTKHKFTIKTIESVIINYYNKCSSCEEHSDAKEQDAFSMILFLTDSEGDYTEIEGTKVFGNTGDVILFNSSDLHSATGAVNSDFRMNMNILFFGDI